MNLAKKEVKSFKFALAGFAFAFKTQTNFKIQTTVGAVVAIMAFFLGFSPTEWIILLFCIALVLSSEMVNTVFETVVDIAAPEYHDKAKIAKDLSAGFVLLISIFVAIVGLILFLPHLMV